MESTTLLAYLDKEVRLCGEPPREGLPFPQWNVSVIGNMDLSNSFNLFDLLWKEMCVGESAM